LCQQMGTISHCGHGRAERDGLSRGIKLACNRGRDIYGLPKQMRGSGNRRAQIDRVLSQKNICSAYIRKLLCNGVESE